MNHHATQNWDDSIKYNGPTIIQPNRAITPDIDWNELFTVLCDTFTFPSDVVRRICISGRPGTGKSGAPWYYFDGARQVERVTIHNSMCPEDLLGSWTLRATNGGTETVWEDGPVTRAMRASHHRISIIVLDEIDKRGPDVETALHQILDDPDMARILLPTGEIITTGPGFGAVATMNGNPDDLSDALRDRFDIFLNADTPSAGVLSGMTDAMSAIVQRTIAESPVTAWRPTITPRRGRAFCRLEKVWDTESAASAMFGAAAPDMLTMLAAVA